MSNYAGDSRAILVHKIQSLVDVFDKQSTREMKMAIISQLLVDAENPAFYSSMIVSLKKSGRIDMYAKEMNNPSYPIDDPNTLIINKPASFLGAYQPTTEFISSGTPATYPTSSNYNISRAKIIRNGTTLVDIVSKFQ